MFGLFAFVAPFSIVVGELLFAVLFNVFSYRYIPLFFISIAVPMTFWTLILPASAYPLMDNELLLFLLFHLL